KNLMNNVNQLSNMTNDDNIKKMIYNNNKIMRENIYMLDNFEKQNQTTEPISQTQNSQESLSINQLPKFFQRFVKDLAGYSEQGAMVDVEAIRGILSTWVRNYGLSLLNQNIGEYKGRYIPVE